MKVTNHNYEEYALDYIEGTLSKEDREVFERFLEAHPDIGAQVSALMEEMPVLEPDLSVRYDDKSVLKRRVPLRPLAIRIGTVAAVLLIGVLLFQRFMQKEPLAGTPETTPLLSGKTPDAEPPVATPEELPALTELSTGSPAQRLLADAQPSPARSAVKMPAETAAKTIPTDPKRGLLTDISIDEPAVQRDARKEESIDTIPVQTGKQPEDENSRPEREAVTSVSGGVKEPLQALAGDPVQVLPENPVLARAAVGTVIFSSEEYVVDRTNEVVYVLETRDYFAEERDQAGLLNVLNRRGLKRLASGILTPLSGLSPIKVYNNNEERVVEFASIPISRRSNQSEEEQIN